MLMNVKDILVEMERVKTQLAHIIVYVIQDLSLHIIMTVWVRESKENYTFSFRKRDGARSSNKNMKISEF